MSEPNKRYRTMKGLWLQLDGPDGCGKDSQAELLVEALRGAGHAVTRSREPGGCPMSERIRGLVVTGSPGDLSPMGELLLFAAARVEHIRQTVRPALNRAEIVVTTRGVSSTVAYQGHAHGLSVDFIRDLHAMTTDGAYPDRMLLLDVPAEVGWRRARARLALEDSGEDRFERMGESLQRHVRTGFLSQAVGEDSWVVIDADAAIGEVHNRVMAAVAPCVEAWLRGEPI